MSSIKAGRAGVLVAVRLEGNGAPRQSSIILTAQAGEDLEMADSDLQKGKWIDFDPATPQHFIAASVNLS